MTAPNQSTLAILICHLESRGDLFKRLLDRLAPQVQYRIEYQTQLYQVKQDVLNPVSILVDIDNGQATTGTKRNRLLDRASTDYVCFIDDDDLISYDYVAKIMAALQTRPDCVGIEGIYTRDVVDRREFRHSREFSDWYERDGIIFRTPNHLNPIRTELALKAKFPDVTLGEDFIFSQRVHPLLKTEVYIKGPIYYHLARGKI